MQCKKDLASHIVAEFHSGPDAHQAEGDFEREVQQGAAPADIREASNVFTVGPNRLPHVLAQSGLAISRTEAERLIKSGALEIDGERFTDMVFMAAPRQYTIRLGKRWITFRVQE
jgi:tyrosyl-tRNA synthetase